MNKDKVLYYCDPEKNKECRKDACGKECFMTTKKEYSRDGKGYRYNADKDKFENLDA